MKTPVSLLTSTLCATLAIPALAQDLVFTHPSGATATFYGQLNFTFQGIDDGVETYQNFVDNSNSVSRVGLWIDVPLGDNEVRFNFETALGILNTAETNQIDDPDWIDWQRTDLRKLEVAYSGGFGTLWLGQGSMATDGAAEIDNSGTSVVGYANLPDTAGAFLFRDGDALSGVAIGAVYPDFDGSRRFRVRYDTPALAGLTFSVAYGQDVLSDDNDTDFYDAAVRYGFDNDVFGFDAALGYGWQDDEGETSEQLMASGSLVHIPTGLNFTVSAGDEQTDDSNFYYVKLGWDGSLIDYGGTAISVDYYDGSDFLSSGSSSTSWGVQAVQTFEDLSLEAYLGYRVFSFDDDTDADYQDVSALLAGARWRF